MVDDAVCAPVVCCQSSLSGAWPGDAVCSDLPARTGLPVHPWKCRQAYNGEVIEPFTAVLASISAAIIQPFDDSVLSYGKVLQFTPGGFGVHRGGLQMKVEASIVLIAVYWLILPRGVPGPP